MKPKAKIPNAFARQSIGIGGEKREWRDVKVTDLNAGDTVSGIGLLESTDVVWASHPQNIISVRLSGPEIAKVYAPDAMLFAFVPVRSVDGAQ